MRAIHDGVLWSIVAMSTIGPQVVGLGMLQAADFRPHTMPLVTIDPYTSCWSMSNRLHDDWPRHWTGRPHAMCGFIRVDGQPARFIDNSGDAILN